MRERYIKVSIVKDIRLNKMFLQLKVEVKTMGKVVDMSDHVGSVSVSCEQEPNDILTFDYYDEDESVGIIVDLEGYKGVEHIFLSKEDTIKLRNFLVKKLGQD
jgi:hypothetical protein